MGHHGMRTTTTQPTGLAESRVRCQVACPVREAAPGKRTGRKTDTAPRADFTRRIPRHRYLEVARHIASGDVSKAELARRFGVSRAALTMWPKRHSALIEEVRRDLHSEYAGPAGDLILAGATAPAA
jgi:hypothetical protein